MTPARECRPTVAVRRVALILVSLAMALLAVNACSSSTRSAAGPAGRSSPASSAVGSPASGLVMIHIEGFRYLTPASVRPGARIEVMNMDGETHTLTADGADSFDVQAPPGQTVEFTAPSKPGRYPFHCAYHSDMHGVLIVT